MKVSQRFLGSMMLFLVFNLQVCAQTEIASFERPEQRKLYQELIAELRCLVCQNQNLADSNAELARDLRRKTREMVRAGSNRQEVVEYMVSRYGDFVLYRPPLKSATVVLWFSPFALLLIIIFIAWRRTRADAAHSSPPTLSDEQLQQVQSLLKRGGK